MKKAVAWLGLDCHSRQSVLAHLDDEGQQVSCRSIPTEPEALIGAVKTIPGESKRLMLEECEISRWIARILRPVVETLVVCDPRENHLLSRHHNKRDDRDAYTLARLLRLGEYKAVWQPCESRRVAFRHATDSYEDAVRHQTRLKLQIKSEYRQWGVFLQGQEVFNKDKQARFLERLPCEARRPVELLHELLASALGVQRLALGHLRQMGREFPEISRLRKIPGIGWIGASLFVAYVQDPKRFSSDAQLHRYCRLGIRDTSSDDKPLGYQRLDRSGHGTLKAISYRAWMTAVRRRQGPVWEFYQESLKRTGNPVHARLNTQRKVLTTMRRLWLNQQEFDAQRFLRLPPSA